MTDEQRACIALGIVPNDATILVPHNRYPYTYIEGTWHEHEDENDPINYGDHQWQKELIVYEPLGRKLSDAWLKGSPDEELCVRAPSFGEDPDDYPPGNRGVYI